MRSVIHIVQGSAGEYSDWQTWSVCAYENEQTARQHAERAQALTAQRREILRAMNYSDREKWVKEHPNHLDPDCRSDNGYDDTSYTVIEVPVRKLLPRGKA